MGPLYRCVLWSSGLLVLVAQAGAGIASPVCAPRNWSSRSTNGRVAVQLTASLIPAGWTSEARSTPKTKPYYAASGASSCRDRDRSDRSRSSASALRAEILRCCSRSRTSSALKLAVVIVGNILRDASVQECLCAARVFLVGALVQQNCVALSRLAC